MKAQVQEPPGRRSDWVPVWQPRGLHCARLPMNTVFLCVEIKCIHGIRQEHLGGSLCGDDAVVIMKLHVAEAELGGATV